jgi:hypothetical protein
VSALLIVAPFRSPFGSFTFWCQARKREFTIWCLTPKGEFTIWCLTPKVNPADDLPGHQEYTFVDTPLPRL